MLSAPTRMAPAASSRSINAASRAAGGRSRLILEPASVGRPATSNRFLTANGTPASGGSFWPFARAASSACARASARRSVTAVKELSSGSRSRMRASVASTICVALTRPAVTAAAMVAAESQEKSPAAVSSMEDRRRLGFVRQREFVDQRREAQDQTQIERDAVVPGRIESETERLRAYRDERVAGIRGLGLGSRARGTGALGAGGFRLAAGFAFHAFGTSKNSSAKWQATCRGPKRRSFGIVVLHIEALSGQRP